MDFTLFKRNYYCLISGLPDLIIDDKKSGADELSMQFKNELVEQLHVNDFDLAKLLYLQYDNKNFQNLLFKQEDEFIPLGNYTQEYIEEQLKEPTTLVAYMHSLLHNFKSGTFKQEDVNEIQSLYYSHVLKIKNKFLKQWFRFDLDMKNILTAVNCRKYNYDLEEQLVLVKDTREVYKYLLKREPKAEELADEVPFADEIIQIAESELSSAEKEKALDEIKWKFLDESTLFNYFTIENILAYIIKLEMVDRWIKIDDETGKALFSKLVHKLKSSYEFSEEFSLTKGRMVEN